ncbi:PWWP domain-containing protein 3-like [Euphorbia lathyris]|uniref:PWWP domain-containing protein 3-like n=1 Tax=Euphorbia lathyris TaxID=212925 RepID=UPI003313A0E6
MAENSTRFLPGNQTTQILPEGLLISRPPLFFGSNYTFWKNRMKNFIQATNMSAWLAIVQGPYMPYKFVDNEKIVKSETEWSEDDLKKLQYNASAINMLHCALDAAEYNKISGCESAQEIWKKLEVTYEGTSKVKESKVNQHMRLYELFEMNDNEDISEMNARFTNIINELKRLGKNFTEEEKVKKILRSLPKSWQAKKTPVEEAQDLTTYKYDELIGSLLTHEISRKNFEAKEKLEDKKQKSLVMKADSTEADSLDDEEMAMFTRKMKKLFRKNEKNSKRPFRRGDRYKVESSEKYKKDSSKSVTCFECHQTRHIKSSCPNLKKDKKGSKKAMVATWSDNDDSTSSEAEATESANICFMADDTADHTQSEHADLSEESEQEEYSNVIFISLTLQIPKPLKESLIMSDSQNLSGGDYDKNHSDENPKSHPQQEFSETPTKGQGQHDQTPSKSPQADLVTSSKKKKKKKDKQPKEKVFLKVYKSVKNHKGKEAIEENEEEVDEVQDVQPKEGKNTMAEPADQAKREKKRKAIQTCSKDVDAVPKKIRVVSKGKKIDAEQTQDTPKSVEKRKRQVEPEEESEQTPEQPLQKKQKKKKSSELSPIDAAPLGFIPADQDEEELDNLGGQFDAEETTNVEQHEAKKLRRLKKKAQKSPVIDLLGDSPLRDPITDLSDMQFQFFSNPTEPSPQELQKKQASVTHPEEQAKTPENPIPAEQELEVQAAQSEKHAKENPAQPELTPPAPTQTNIE